MLLFDFSADALFFFLLLRRTLLVRYFKYNRLERTQIKYEFVFSAVAKLLYRLYFKRGAVGIG